MSLAELVSAYFQLGSIADTKQREQLRQYYLFMIWANGGDPWALDPAWVPPLP